MENKTRSDFIAKFNKLDPDNQRYLIAVQQALAFAQSSSSDAKKSEKKKRCEKVS